MFLKKAVLKKLMKQAYKHAGLTVGHHMKDMEGKFIGSFAWTAWFREGHMPKEIMAQVIELCGEMPEEGQQFTATTSGLGEQGNAQDISYLPRLAEGDEHMVTDLMQYQGSDTVRFLQDMQTGEMLAVNNVFPEMVDPGEIESREGETPPIGPYVVPNTNMVIWHSNMCWLMCLARAPRTDIEREYWNALGRMDWGAPREE